MTRIGAMPTSRAWRHTATCQHKTYTLRIRAFLLEKPGKYDTCTVVVKVPPHFLLSANAVWIYIILIIAVAIFMLHLRQERMARMARMRS